VKDNIFKKEKKEKKIIRLQNSPNCEIKADFYKEHLL
jgi:hypothetical protein